MILHRIMNFFKLFIDEDVSSLGSAGISLLFLFGSIIWYLVDFYKLVKRKSQAENITIMIFPVAVSAWGAIMAMIYVHVPAPGHLEEFAAALSNRDICLGLGTLTVIYAAVWLISYLSQRKRKRTDVRNWIVSCVPDYCFVAIILLGTAFSGFVKIDLLLWLYLYSIYLLACKVILLVVGNATRLFSMKITIVRWSKWKNPHTFLARYFFFYQNAIARNVLFFMIGALTFLTVALCDVGWSGQTASIMAFLYLGSLLPMAFTAAPMKGALNRLAAWGDRVSVERLFCQEYFVEEHLYHDQNFTVTKHFLIEEQSPAMFYYLPNLKSVSGWVIDQTGRHRMISFSDGMQCRITPEEAEGSEQMFQYLQRNQTQNSYSFNNADWEKQNSYADRKEMEEEAAERGKMNRQVGMLAAIVLVAGICAVFRYVTYLDSDAYAYKEYLKSGQENFQDGYYRNAMEDFENALSLMPESEEAEEGYFYSLLGLARESAAISNTSTTLYAMLLQQRPQESYLYGEMAQLYLMQEDYLEMLSILEKGYEETVDPILQEKADYAREHIWAEKMEYFYDDELSKIYLYDQNGNVLTDEEYVTDRLWLGYANTYDEEQNLISQKTYVEDDKEIMREDVYTYDENQNRISKMTYNYNDGERENTSNHEEYYAYDEMGREIARYSYYSDNNWWFCVWTEYDEKGRIQKKAICSDYEKSLEEMVAAQGTLTEYHMYQDQEDGSYIEIVQYYDEESVGSLEINKYDAKGQCVEGTCYYCLVSEEEERDSEIMIPQDEALWNATSEEIAARTVEDWLELTDALYAEGESGATVATREIREYDESGNIIYYESDEYRETTKYDEQQRMISTTVQRMGFFTANCSYEYDAMNQMILDSTEIVYEEEEEPTYREERYDYTYAYSGEDIWQ